MKISKHSVVSIDYTLTNDAGKVLDSSKGREPLSYIQGMGSLIPGLENALEGKGKGESLKVSIPPKDGYGERDEGLVQDVPRDQFGEGAEVEIGMQFQVDTEGGEVVVTVVGVEPETVKVDGNHPLAGETLNFDVTVSEVRAATEEELHHGHVHGPGGHHHH